MNKQQLVEQIRRKKSFLCVGLDSDSTLLPPHLPQTAEGVLTFNKAIIDATADLAVAYKPNEASMSRWAPRESTCWVRRSTICMSSILILW